VRPGLGGCDKISQGQLPGDWVSERLLGVELIVVAPADAYAAHVARVNEVREDAVDRPSGQAGGLGDFPNPNLGVLRQRE
jgi:hypothetical protein